MVTAACTIRAVFILTVFTPCVLLCESGGAVPSSLQRNVPHLLQVRSHKNASVTGSYDGPNKASLDVLQLPGKRIQFDLMALADLSSPSGPKTGESSGIAALHDGVAVYKPDASQSDGDPTSGNLVMHFRGDKVVVSQQGQMPGYGIGVTASGTYVRRSRKPPKFNKGGQAI